MLTKSDYLQAVADTFNQSPDSYGTIAPLWRASDPTMRQHIEAMAAMLALHSAQIETAMMEPFDKVRDTTILADAALRGLTPKGSPMRVRILVENSGLTPVTLSSGTVLYDSSGIEWRIETPATIPAQGSAKIEARQLRAATMTHTVSNTTPFYAIEIPEANDGEYLSTLSVAVNSDAFEYRERYINTEAGEKVFHVEADDRQAVYVRFGWKTVVGVQPENGDTVTIIASYTAGALTTLTEGSPFALWQPSPAQQPLKFALDAEVDHASPILEPGQSPLSMTLLRDLARYPSVYDHNAVFLGEFDFLVRRHFAAELDFLSVWNESLEEKARGATIDNINTLFVACIGTEETGIALDYPTATAAITPVTGDLRDRIRTKILDADDSYKVVFYRPVVAKIPMTISATVSTAYVADDVATAIREAILNEFGADASGARRGGHKPRYQRVYALLREKIPALSTGEADLTVSIGAQDEAAIALRPEIWRYVAEDSLTATVEQRNVAPATWG